VILFLDWSINASGKSFSVLPVLGLFLDPRIAFTVSQNPVALFFGMFILSYFAIWTINRFAIRDDYCIRITVDDGAVVAENIYEKFMKLTPLQAAIQGTVGDSCLSLSGVPWCYR
jgi:hypothetical protein